MGSNNSGSVERAYLIRGPGLEGKKKGRKKKIKLAVDVETWLWCW